MTTMTIDDEIAQARTRLEELTARLAGKRDAAAAARAEFDQLEASEPDPSGHRTEEHARWERAQAAVIRRHAAAVDGIAELERLIREQTTWVGLLEARRIPKVDDAIAADRARLVRITILLEDLAGDVAAAEARIRAFDVSAALEEPLPAGEPASSNHDLATARAAIAELEAEQHRLELRVTTLLERRASTAAELVAEKRTELEARWEALAGEALDAAVRLHAVAVDLETLEEGYRAAGAALGPERIHRVPTVSDVRFSVDQLELLVRLARGLELRTPVAR